MKLWQLINPQTGENLSGLQELPENWGPIFGMSGVKDRLGDLSWLGIADRAWIEVDAPEPVTDQKSAVDVQINQLIKEADENLQTVGITKKQWQQWSDYKRQLENLCLYPTYPEELPWPNRPE